MFYQHDIIHAMSTGINYNFNKETFMGTDNHFFDDLFNKTHKVPDTKIPILEEIEEDIPDHEIMDDLDLD